MLAPVQLADYGIAHRRCSVDPSRFGASHLACFAVNGVATRFLEDVYRDPRATRPSELGSLRGYLKGIRTGQW
jgi:hypothetical protein